MLNYFLILFFLAFTWACLLLMAYTDRVAFQQISFPLRLNCGSNNNTLLNIVIFIKIKLNMKPNEPNDQLGSTNSRSIFKVVL